jgi:glutathione S-transferase
MAPTITLFDIPSHLPNKHSSSPFTWRIRLALNYKGIPYTTQWVPTYDIKTVCEANGLPPTETTSDGSPFYTLPAIIDSTDPNNIVRISDSHAIAEYLDKTYPDHPLNPNDARTKEVAQYVVKNIFPPLSPLFFAEYKNVAPERLLAHYAEVCKTRYKTTLEAIASKAGSPGSKEREGLWEALHEGLKGVGFEEAGPWLDGGENPTYKDFIVVAALANFYLSSRDTEGWSRLMLWDGGKWKRLWEASQKYSHTQ